MIWSVIALSKDKPADALEGMYGGVTAGATAVVGGLDKLITLQPISVEGNTGLSVTVAIDAMQLRQEK